MHLCLTMECITCGLHSCVFLLSSPLPPATTSLGGPGEGWKCKETTRIWEQHNVLWVNQLPSARASLPMGALAKGVGHAHVGCRAQ